MEYKSEPVKYSGLYAYVMVLQISFIAGHCLSRLVLNILRVMASIVPSESEFLRTSSVLWCTSNLSLYPLHHPSALRNNISGSSRSNPFMILNSWIISLLQCLKSSDGNLRACNLSSYCKSNYLENISVLIAYVSLSLR